TLKHVTKKNLLWHNEAKSCVVNFKIACPRWKTNSRSRCVGFVIGNKSTDINRRRNSVLRHVRWIDHLHRAPVRNPQSAIGCFGAVIEPTETGLHPIERIEDSQLQFAVGLFPP